jgi:hypothetical protein
MVSSPRRFTLAQANALVKMIRPLLSEIMEIRQVILRRQPEVWPVVEKAAGNGGSRQASEAALEFARLDQLVREIQATGAVLKDINQGLVDFLADRNGQDVFLCWQYGEDRIEFWHGIDDGFAGRQSIEAF